MLILVYVSKDPIRVTLFQNDSKVECLANLKLLNYSSPTWSEFEVIGNRIDPTENEQKPEMNHFFLDLNPKWSNPKMTDFLINPNSPELNWPSSNPADPLIFHLYSEFISALIIFTIHAFLVYKSKEEVKYVEWGGGCWFLCC